MPADEKEALTSDLMGLFEKRRFKNFLVYVQEFDLVRFYTVCKKTRTKIDTSISAGSQGNQEIAWFIKKDLQGFCSLGVSSTFIYYDG